jgi:heterodisulfide reductase subunit B
MNEYIFYPGCSMEGSAKMYYDSLNAIKGTLDMELHEIDDWNCCGATEYVGMNLIPAYALIARNLALASKQTSGNKTVMAPCSACYLNLEKADHYMAERPALEEKVNEALAAGGLNYKPGSLDIRHLLDVLAAWFPVPILNTAGRIMNTLRNWMTFSRPSARMWWISRSRQHAAAVI